MPLFIHPADEEITAEVVKKFIDLHQAELSRYKRLEELYQSDAPILSKEKKPEYKPDNRLVVNYAKYLTDTFNGYFVGIPVKVGHEDDDINESVKDFIKRNDMDDNFAELAKMTSIYGHAFEFLYQDENSNTGCIYNDPKSMFIVYDDTIVQRPLFGVYYRKTEDGIKGQLFTVDKEIIIAEGKNGLYLGEEKQHYYQGVPIIEYLENEERQSLFEVVETLINAYDKAISEKANDVDYFADAYLAILGAELDEEGIHRIRDNRIINLFGTDNAKDIIVQFLQKPDGDTTQENLLNRIDKHIYQIAMVANINDESYGNASGTALEFKLQPMKNLAIMKERKFTSGMNRRFKMFFALPTNVPSTSRDEWQNLNYKFTRNIPRNISDEINNAKNAQGILSEETQLSLISVVDNVKEEIERKRAEESMDPYAQVEVGEDETWDIGNNEQNNLLLSK